MIIEINIPNEIAERAKYITFMLNEKGNCLGFRLFDSGDFSCMPIFEKILEEEVSKEVASLIYANVYKHLREVKRNEKN